MSKVTIPGRTCALPRIDAAAHEDRIVNRLRNKGFAEEVEAQHTALAHQGCDLMRDLESVIRGQDLSWELETLS